MGVGVNSGLRHAPDYTPHRVRVTAADGAGGPTNKKAGMVAEPYEDIHADIKLQGTNVTVELMIWSELVGAFVSLAPAVTTAALTASAVVKFNVGGNRFFLKCTGTFTQVDISCAGINPIQQQSA